MDQGLAAVLGAAVGAIATGGGAILAGRSAARLQRSGQHREVYRAYIEAAFEVNRCCYKLKEPDQQGVEALSQQLHTLQARLPLLALEAPRAVVKAAEELINSAHAVQGVAARMVAGEDPTMLVFVWVTELNVMDRVPDDLTLTSGASVSLNMTPYQRLIALNKIVLDDFVEWARQHM